MTCLHCGKPAASLYRGYCPTCIDWASGQTAENETEEE